MVQINLDDSACRCCNMCTEVCPTEVFILDDPEHAPLVSSPDDCIGCLSCVYACPSQAIVLRDYHAVKNFYRDLTFSRAVERFL